MFSNNPTFDTYVEPDLNYDFESNIHEAEGSELLIQQLSFISFVISLLIYIFFAALIYMKNEFYIQDYITKKLYFQNLYSEGKTIYNLDGYTHYD